ncbi:HU family DNA-binding protein [Lentibacter algarum]|uniref:HU family DNA-binding protein n=1 Tax=Lentibacter algarum TaxID=576131 RepID=UPI001C0A551B|nr:HU family DNA-binding protein [Lentibacter algarum]MBU2982568.1 HU family DNA-binding protein [Lentibacter algarum]
MAAAPKKSKTTGVKKAAAPAKPARKAAKKAAPKTPETVAPAPLSAPSPIAKAAEVEPVIVTSNAPSVGMIEMRKEQLLDEVAERTGAKRKDVKPVVEAVLEVMGRAIGDGQELNLKPFGKVKIARTKQVANGRVINIRLRQSDMVIKELEGDKQAAE